MQQQDLSTLVISETGIMDSELKRPLSGAEMTVSELENLPVRKQKVAVIEAIQDNYSYLIKLHEEESQNREKAKKYDQLLKLTKEKKESDRLKKRNKEIEGLKAQVVNEAMGMLKLVKKLGINVEKELKEIRSLNS